MERYTKTDHSPLFIACHKVHIEVVKFLIASGVDKDRIVSRDHGVTALMVAKVARHHSIVAMLKKSSDDNLANCKECCYPVSRQQLQHGRHN